MAVDSVFRVLGWKPSARELSIASGAAGTLFGANLVVHLATFVFEFGELLWFVLLYQCLGFFPFLGMLLSYIGMPRPLPRAGEGYLHWVSRCSHEPSRRRAVFGLVPVRWRRFYIAVLPYWVVVATALFLNLNSPSAELRLVSLHWMIFTGIPYVWFRYVYTSLRDDLADAYRGEAPTDA